MSLSRPEKRCLLCVAVSLLAGLGCGAGEAGRADAGAVLADAPPDAASREAAASAADSGRAEAPAACQADDDCQLVSDCCWCGAIRRGEKPPSCDPNRSCVMAVCAQYPDVNRARCAAGRCVLGFDCDTTMVSCKRLPPVCPAGQVPRVIGPAGGRCYGECVDANQCLSVPSCAACRPTDLCIQQPSTPAVLHCSASTSSSREM